MWHIYKTANGAVSKPMREAEKCVFAICALNWARVRRRVFLRPLNPPDTAVDYTLVNYALAEPCRLK